MKRCKYFSLLRIRRSTYGAEYNLQSRSVILWRTFWQIASKGSYGFPRKFELDKCIARLGAHKNSKYAKLTHGSTLLLATKSFPWEKDDPRDTIGKKSIMCTTFQKTKITIDTDWGEIRQNGGNIINRAFWRIIA
jgi:hypothetical protein